MSSILKSQESGNLKDEFEVSKREPGSITLGRTQSSNMLAKDLRWEGAELFEKWKKASVARGSPSKSRGPRARACGSCTFC